MIMMLMIGVQIWGNCGYLVGGHPHPIDGMPNLDADILKEFGVDTKIARCNGNVLLIHDHWIQHTYLSGVNAWTAATNLLQDPAFVYTVALCRYILHKDFQIQDGQLTNSVHLYEHLNAAATKLSQIQHHYSKYAHTITSAESKLRRLCQEGVQKAIQRPQGRPLTVAQLAVM